MFGHACLFPVDIAGFLTDQFIDQQSVGISINSEALNLFSFV